MRTRNNKNIQTMKQKDIDIYEILKDMPDGTPLYTSMCGNVIFTGCDDNKETLDAIMVENKNGGHDFNAYGKYAEDGEVLLFPSKEMRDWSKFFKKGDVLEYKGENNCKGTCIFESYEDEMTKLNFTGLYILQKGKIRETSMSFRTVDWVKSDDPAGYIKTVEEQLGGKLNLETLKVEKQEKPAFELGKLYVFDEEDEDGKVTVIGKLIGKEEGELTIGNQYEIENENFVTDETFFLNISLHKELREATENEVELFNKHCAIREKEKQAKEQPAFKPFDKVLVRCNKKYKWLPAFFVRDRGDEYAWRYKVLCIHSGKPADFAYCIPFEGHENIAFTDYDIENLPL